MRKIILALIVSVATVLPALAQGQTIKEKLSKFFFDISFDVDINLLRIELENNPNFKFYNDPNRDARKTIIGTIKKDENLNTLCTDNQVIIQYSSAEVKKSKKVSVKWSMNYALGDLAGAMVDFERLKSEFKPLFTHSVDTKKTGAQKEKINSLVLKEKSMNVTITLIEYINFSHTISLEYLDTWKTGPTKH
jgi:hypothetical protein